MVRKSSVRLFVNETLAEGASLELTRDAAHYVSNVMRLGVGDPIVLFNGRDGEWQGTIRRATRKGCTVGLLGSLRSQPVELDVWIAAALVKRARMDFLVEKATELGVTRIVPVTTRRTVVSRANVNRLTLRATEAAEQCGRLSVPEVMEVQELELFLASLDAGSQVLWCDESGDSPAVNAVLARLSKTDHSGPWILLTGPEGGFDQSERKLIGGHAKVTGIDLGRHVLRSETADTVALGIFQAWMAGS